MNNNETAKISASQLFCVLMLSRISAEIVFPSVGGMGGECVFALIGAELIRFALALPVIIWSLSKRTADGGFYGAIYKRNSFFGWVAAVGAVLLLVGASAKTLYGAACFAQRSLLPDFSVVLIGVFAALFAVYCAVMGAEAIARSGVLFLVAAALVTLAVILADIPYMRFDAVMPPQLPEYKGLARDVTERLLRGGDYLVFAALIPYVREGKRSAGRSSLFFALFGALAGILLCGFFCLTLRELFGMVEYPFTAAASLSDIALFKRLDGIGAGLWTLCAAFRAGLMLFAGYAVLGEMIHAPRENAAEPAKGGESA